MTSNNIRLTNVNGLKKNYYSIHFCLAKLRSNIFERFRPKYVWAIYRLSSAERSIFGFIAMYRVVNRLAVIFSIFSMSQLYGETP